MTWAVPKATALLRRAASIGVPAIVFAAVAVQIPLAFAQDTETANPEPQASQMNETAEAPEPTGTPPSPETSRAEESETTGEPPSTTGEPPPATSGSETTETPAEAPATAPAAAPEAAEVPTIPVNVDEPQELVGSDATVLDDIVVTAQKQVQSIMDVPISITVVDRQFLSDQGIDDLTEMSRFVPGLKIKADIPNSQSASIRGFTKQPGNPAFDQAVGLSIDGVPYNDNDFFVTSLFDVERVEVLRGPQGTFNGKNTTAGEINVTTGAPTDALAGFFDVVEGDFQRRKIEFGLGAPLLTDFVHFRLAGVRDESGGYMKNTTAALPEARIADHLMNRDRTGLRGQFAFPDLFGAALSLSYERATISILGEPQEIRTMTAAGEEFLRKYDPNVDVEPGNLVTSVNSSVSTERTVDKALVTLGYDLGSWNLHALAGYAMADSFFDGGDGTPAPLVTTAFTVKKPQTSYEARLTSPDLPGFFGVPRLFGLDLGSTHFILGVSYQERVLKDFSRLFAAHSALFIEWTRTDDANPPPPSPSTPPGDPDDVVFSVFNQVSDMKSVFGQFDWRLADRWTLIAGGRQSREDKTGDWVQSFVSSTNVVTEQLLMWEEFTARLEKKEKQFQPKISLQYEPYQNLSLFLHRAEGFRSGGFNAFATRDDFLDYEEEQVVEWALTAKARLFDGTVRLNAGLFRMELEDFQLLTRDPQALTAVTRNAGGVLAQGFEADLSWLPLSWFSLNAGVAYNDNKLLNFPHGPCAQDRPNTDGDADERCDLTGQPLPNSPRWSGTLVPRLRIPLGGGLEVNFGAAAEYQSFVYAGLPGDERFIQPSFYRYAADFGVGSSAGGWSLRMVGENLNDESIAYDIGTFAGVNHFHQSVERPRQVYGQLRFTF